MKFDSFESCVNYLYAVEEPDIRCQDVPRDFVSKALQAVDSPSTQIHERCFDALTGYIALCFKDADFFAGSAIGEFAESCLASGRDENISKLISRTDEYAEAEMHRYAESFGYTLDDADVVSKRFVSDICDQKMLGDPQNPSAPLYGGFAYLVCQRLVNLDQPLVAIKWGIQAAVIASCISKIDLSDRIIVWIHRTLASELHKGFSEYQLSEQIEWLIYLQGALLHFKQIESCRLIATSIDPFITPEMECYRDFARLRSELNLQLAKREEVKNPGKAAELFELGLASARESGSDEQVDEVMIQKQMHKARISGDMSHLEILNLCKSSKYRHSANIYSQLACLQRRKDAGELVDDDKQQIASLAIEISKLSLSVSNIEEAGLMAIEAMKCICANYKSRWSAQLYFPAKKLAENILDKVSSECQEIIRKLLELGRYFEQTSTMVELSPNDETAINHGQSNDWFDYLGELNLFRDKLSILITEKNIGGLESKESECRRLISMAVELCLAAPVVSPKETRYSVWIWKDITSILGTLVFKCFGFSGDESTFSVTLRLDGDSTKLEIFKLLLQFFELQKGKLLSEYWERDLATRLQRLELTPREEFLKKTGDLARELCAARSINQLKREAAKVEIEKAKSILEYLEGLALFGMHKQPRKNSVAHMPVDGSNNIAFPLFCEQAQIGFVQFHRSQVKLWFDSSRECNYFALRDLISRMWKAPLSPDELELELNQLVAKDGKFNSYRNSDSLLDLSGSGLPLVLAETVEPYEKLFTSSQTGDDSSFRKLPRPRISFWAPFGNGYAGMNCDFEKGVLWAADREFHLWRQNHRDVNDQEFQQELLLTAEHERPLPFSCLEESGIRNFPPICRYEDKNQYMTGFAATRESFLANNWSKFNVIHVSSHSMFYGDSPHLSHISLHDKSKDLSCIHYYDILSLDLSSIHTVFLNCCSTLAGEFYGGDEYISLAWAFRAAGAANVIATRWPIPDNVAFEFSLALYQEGFGGCGLPRTPFIRARKRIAKLDPCDAIHWRAFELIE